MVATALAAPREVRLELGAAEVDLARALDVREGKILRRQARAIKWQEARRRWAKIARQNAQEARRTPAAGE